MSNVILTNGVRQNLLALQQTTKMQGEIQQRLATGKRVNTAVDGPVNFFTSGALNGRASQLQGLMDGMSNAVQTIQTASRGIDAITRLVNSTQSTLKQALNDAAQNRPTKPGLPRATATESVNANKSLRDITLDKSLIDDNAGAANDATATYAGNLGMTGAVIGISITAGSNVYTASFPSANATMRDLVNEINKSGIATAFVDEKGQLNVKGTGSEPLQFGVGAAATGPGAITDAAAGGANTNVGFLVADAAVATAIPSPGITSAVRSNLIQQFNDLREQMDQLAKDSSFNGLNLLAGDQLTVQFNEKTGTNKTKLSIQGSIISAENLGIQRAGNTQVANQFNFQNDLDIEKALNAITTSLTSLRSVSSTLGSNLAVVQARQDFTKDMINTLKVGADNLVLADSNEEGANLLALNTRQQLSQTALSLASQADQSVLRLFG